jgi:hypothetical protein
MIADFQASVYFDTKLSHDVECLTYTFINSSLSSGETSFFSVV